MLVVTEDHSNYQKLLLIDHISQVMWSNSLYKTWVIIKRKLNGQVLGPLVHSDFISVALSLFFIACLPFHLYSSSLQSCPPLTGSFSVFRQNLSFSFLYHEQFVAMLHGTSFFSNSLRYQYIVSSAHCSQCLFISLHISNLYTCDVFLSSDSFFLISKRAQIVYAQQFYTLYNQDTLLSSL